MSLSESIAIDHHQSWWDIRSPELMAMLVAFGLFGLSFYIDYVALNSKIRDQRTSINAMANIVSARLQGGLSSSAYLSLGLVAYISANPHFTQDSFEHIAASMMRTGHHIKDIVVAPDNVVQYVYPLKGNEKVLGLRYMENAEQRDAVMHMITTRQFVLAGPVNLVQGGTGLINRLPIFVTEGSGEHQTEQYWGLVSVVLDMESLLDEGGVVQHSSRGAANSIEYALRGKDGLGAAGGMIYGNPEVFNQDPILLDIVMPGDSRWQLAAIPAEGWKNSLTQLNNPWFLRIALLTSLLLSGLMYVWLVEIRKIKFRDMQLRLAASVFQSANEGILITNQDRIVIAVNPAVTTITGFKPDEILNQPSRLLSSGKMTQRQLDEMHSIANKEGVWQGEVWSVDKNGIVFPSDMTIAAVYDPQGKAINFVNTFSDVSARKLAEERIFHLAHHDALTGLPNRMDLYGKLDHAIASAVRRNKMMAAMVLDMDNFKIINDTLGHHVGDGLLVEIASRLRTSIRDSDIVARLGGDEFVVVLTEVESPMAAANVAEKILQNLGEVYFIDGYELHSTPSIGIGMYPSDGDSAVSLLKNVDAAMYHAKAMGRNNYQFFTEGMRLAVGERLNMENSLRQAIAKEEFLLQYQPQIDIRSGRVVGVEALIRWNHPYLGMVPPVKFISIAEESDLIIAIGEWVLTQACMQAKQWQDMGIRDIRMSINLSARQLRSKNLFALVESQMALYGFKPSDLELEITESVAMDSPEKTIELLGRLRSLGVELAIDDFGTGYSSLSYLKLLPLNRLKIDRSFVKDIETDPNDAAICAATIAIAHILGLSLVAEGVETESQLNYLRDQGCDVAQGYLFSRPLSAEDFVKFLLARGELEASNT